jgi:hypothetical protein
VWDSRKNGLVLSGKRTNRQYAIYASESYVGFAHSLPSDKGFDSHTLNTFTTDAYSLLLIFSANTFASSSSRKSRYAISPRSMYWWVCAPVSFFPPFGVALFGEDLDNLLATDIVELFGASKIGAGTRCQCTYEQNKFKISLHVAS